MVRKLVALALSGQRFVDAMEAAWSHDDAVLPIDLRLPPSARKHLLDTLRPAELIDRDGRHQLSGAVPVLPHDALVVPTSGTTGQPKGVVLTHQAVAASAQATNARLGIDPNMHRWYATLPLAHIGGLSVVTRALASGTPLTVADGFDVEATNRAAESGHTHTSLVVTALRRINPAAWHTILVGGSAMPDDLPAMCVRTYGMTESGSGIVYNGILLDGVRVEIDEHGEILLGGPMLFRAYRGGANLTPEGHDPKRADGLFATGDSGSWGPDGTLRVVGRMGDVIVTGGEKVWPDAVERGIGTLPGVVDFAVAGTPDRMWGHVVTLFIVLSAGAATPSLDDLRDSLRAELPSYALPKSIRVLDAMPRTASGKIHRRLLSSMAPADGE